MSNRTPATLRQKVGVYPDPDAWRAARHAVNADTNVDLALILDVDPSTISRARLHIGDEPVGGDFVALAVYAFRDHYASPFDFLFRVRRAGA